MAAGTSGELLPDWYDRLPWSHKSGGVHATEVLRGSTDTMLAVVLAYAATEPARTDLRAAWRARRGKGLNPVLLAVRYPGADGKHVALLGIDEDAQPVYGVDVSLTEQLLRDALEMTSPLGLHQEVTRRLGSLSGGIGAGVRNEGLFASHVLEQQPDRPDWTDLCVRGETAREKRGEDLLTTLGYVVEAVPDGLVLREASDQHRRAAAVLLAAGESFENPLSRFHDTNAVQHGINLARREGVDWVVVLGGSVIRLYPVSPDVGVGRKGQTQTYAELDLALLAPELAGHLALLFAPRALAEGGDVEHLLGDSARYATGLSERLRDRIYRDVVPNLALAVANRLGVTSTPKAEQRAALDEAYHQTMILLFRLLFVAYAEDRGLLPYETSEPYRRNALKTHALDMAKDPEAPFSASATTLWDDLTQVWRVIDKGDVEGWGVPPYDGGLFTGDPAKNESGAATYDLNLTNAEVGPALRGLLVDRSADGVAGPVDFRSLSVREFGTIYEGLLESTLGVADTDLVVDQNDTYVPAEAGAAVDVRRGEVYFHARGGSRKGTGSYFTKPFAVEHLLNTSLEPALTAHLERVRGLLDSGVTRSAAAALFDFRVADLTMGSGHFLVAAIDRIEARFSAFLADHPLPEVAVELERLRDAAAAQLQPGSSVTRIDDGMLLRRQIARRCIYGVDINEVAVELARLAVWIHTFVPGLPLSFLNHGLIQGNSLSGVGTLAEVGEAITEADAREHKTRNTAQRSSFDAALEEFLGRAAEHLAALAELSDASIGDISAATDLQARLERDLAPLAALCDLVTAERATRHLKTDDDGRIKLTDAPGIAIAITADGVAEAVLAHPRLAAARELAAEVMATHLPVRFPEVFRREPPGFDCIVGNPPWDKVRHEPQQFWVTVSPGLNRLRDEDRDTEIEHLRATRPVDAEREQREIAWRTVQQNLFKAAFTWRGGTHVELAQLVLERALRITRSSGRLGLVVPRQFTVLAGWSKLRERLTQHYELVVVQGRNQGQWIFDGIHESYAVVLLSAARSPRPATLLAVATSVADIEAWSAETSIALTGGEIDLLSDTFVLPWFGSSAERVVFDRMRSREKLASGRGWVTGRHDARWDFRRTGPEGPLSTREGGAGAWRVLMTAHVDAFAFDPSVPFKQYVTDFAALVAKDRGVVEDDDGQPVLGEAHPLVILRHPSRSDDSRTLIATALPESGLLHNKGYIHAVAHAEGTPADRILALLGYLNTFVADWWARRFVDRHVTAPVVNQLALPDWTDDQIGEAARIVSSLLARAGMSRLAGGVDAADVRSGEDANSLLARLNRLALDGFGLDRADMEVMLRDFSDKGVPPGLRGALSASFGVTGGAA